MAGSRKTDPRLTTDPPSYSKRVNSDGSVSYVHRYKVNGHSRSGPSIRRATEELARAAAWADYDDYLKDRDDGALEEKREQRLQAKKLITEKLADWLAAQKPVWSVASFENADMQVHKRIEPYWGEWPVSRIRRAEVTNFRNVLMDPENGYGTDYHLPTVQSCMRQFSAFCTWLVDEDGSLDANPCIGLPVRDIDYVEDAKGKRDPLTPEQIERISKAVAELTRKEGGGNGRQGKEVPLPPDLVWQHRTVIYMLCYIGIRPEDISRARWSDCIDPDTEEFMPNMTVRRAKTAAGRKPRELFDPVVDSLRMYYQMAGRPDLDERIIRGERGGAHNPHNWLARVWKPALQKAGIKKYRVPYALRHSLVSNLALANHDPRATADQAGHGSPAFTMTRYASSFADGRKRRGIPFDEQIRQARLKVFGYDFADELARRRAAS